MIRLIWGKLFLSFSRVTERFNLKFSLLQLGGRYMEESKIRLPLQNNSIQTCSRSAVEFSRLWSWRVDVWSTKNQDPTPSSASVVSELIKMQSQLVAQFMPFFRLIAHILTFRDKKYRILMFRDKMYRILKFCNKKYCILTFRDKTESYLTVLQQNNAEAC